MFEASLHLFPLGRVEHKRNLDARRKSRGKRVHIGNAVAADKIDVDVENMCTFFFLRFGEIYKPVPILCFKQIAHLFRTRCVHALADDKKRSVLRIRLLKINRRGRRGEFCITLFWRNAAQTFDHPMQMFGGCAAASANNIRSKILCKMLDLGRKTLRRLVIMLFTVLNLGQTGVWQNRNRQRRILTQITKTVGHMLRPGAAVHTNNINWKRLKSGQSRTDLRAIEHRPENLDCDRGDHRKFDLLLLKMLKDGCQRGLCLQQILTRFDHQKVGTAINQTANLFDVSGFQIVICDMPERRQFRPRSDGTRNETRFVVCRITARHPLCQFRRLKINIVGLIRDPKLDQYNFASAKAVRLDNIAPDIQKRRMDSLDSIGPCIKQILGAVLKIRPAPILDRQTQRLQIRPHRTVKNDDLFFK